MCGSKPPKADVTAAAQEKANINTARVQTELNRYNETNPLGSQTWTTDPNNPNKYSLNTTYDPRLMTLLDNQLNNSANLQNYSSKNVPGLTGFQTNLGDTTANLLNNTNDVLNRGTPKYLGLSDAERLLGQIDQRFYDNGSNVKSTMDVARNSDNVFNNQLNRFNTTASTPFNFNNAPGMPTTDEATRKAVADAIYNRATSRLDPRFQQENSELSARLAAQGITQGSRAYDNEIAGFNRDKNDAYSTAMQDAEIGSMNALNSQFANGLAARQQGVNEATTLRDQVGKEALIASQLAGGANNNATNQLNAQVNRNNAVTNAANNVMDMYNKGTDNEMNARNQALGELANGIGMYNGVQSAISNNANSGLPNFSYLSQFSQGSGGGAGVATTPYADLVNQNAAAKAGNTNNLVSGVSGIAAAAIIAL